MSRLPVQNPLYRFFWTFDSYVSSGAVRGLGRRSSAGARPIPPSSTASASRGLKRIVVDLIDDAATFGTVAAFGLLAYALPPFSGTGDIWNKGREYAVTFTDANGEIIGRRGIRQDDAIPLEDIPPHVIKAVLATEDARFYEHFGVDMIGTVARHPRERQGQ